MATYLGSRDAPTRQAVALASSSEALGATAIVVGSVWLAHEGTLSVMSRAESIEIVSYVLLTVSGAWTLYSALTKLEY